MPPKKRTNQILDSAVPSASDGASSSIELDSTRKKKKIINNISVRNSNPINISTRVTSSSPNPTGFCGDIGFPLAPLRQHTAGLLSDVRIAQPTHCPNDIEGVTNAYDDVGDCNCVCSFCGAMFWHDERLKTSSSAIRFNRCCEGGRVDLPREEEPPAIIVQLLSNKIYVENIRAYNQMFSMASYGAQIDDTINNGRGPYVFKISGHVYHWIGSLCLEEGNPPRFLQLYIYDTVNEVQNRMRFFGGDNSVVLRAEIVRLYSVIGTRQYELPTSDAIGAIVFYSGDNTRTDYDMIIEQPGYHPELRPRNVRGGGGRRKDKMTMNMFYSYQLHDRYNMFGLLSKCGRLFQQYVVTAYCSIELNKLDYVRNNQQDIHNEYLSGLYDAINRGDHYGADVGSRTILPASFTGGPRYMYSHYLDALAICRVHGNPKFFITCTCNAKWPEIRRYLRKFPGLTSTDRGDIVARIFNMKVKQFVSVLKQEELFGPSTAVLYTIEFQKRGLPHCHTLLWIKPSLRSYQPQDVDRFISAELPDPVRDPNGFRVVSDMMMHGPCGLLNKKAPCMEESESTRESFCSKKFPKPFNEQTYFDKDGYVHYQRHNLGISADKKICRLDNGYVVPYNRTLCLRFHAHNNVEWCGWSMLIKYLFKYISKGTDRVAAYIPRPIGCSTSTDIVQNSNVDEIKNFVDARFICAPEACWRIFNFLIHSRKPAVQILAVHLKDMQLVKFHSNQRLKSIVNNPVSKKTTLTEWLFYNRNSSDGRHLTYLDFPLEFVWADDHKRWKRRCNLPGSVYPAFGEVFYLRMLLCHQKGSTSFEDLMTVNNSVHSTYREACLAMGLLGDDKEWLTAMEEAAATATSAQLRLLFSHILQFCDVTDPLKLWKQC
ncbi:uncharacterized protein [Rutidosis leptorrhynchoides]|uniref:uncharacterized protein n=1 Tax=Rutidosis leptorrhynchoides TaxID=125765 RepID=UPI003A9905D3